MANLKLGDKGILKKAFLSPTWKKLEGLEVKIIMITMGGAFYVMPTNPVWEQYTIRVVGKPQGIYTHPWELERNKDGE